MLSVEEQIARYGQWVETQIPTEVAPPLRSRESRQRRLWVGVAALSAVLIVIGAVAWVTTHGSEQSLDTVASIPSTLEISASSSSSPDALLSDRWIIDGLTPQSIREEPLPIGETLEIYGIPAAVGIGLDKWVAMSVSNNLSDRNVAVGFGNEATKSSLLEGGNEIGVMKWQDQTQVAFTDHLRRLVVLSGRGVASDDLIAVAQHFVATEPPAYTLAGTEPIRQLPKLVTLGPTDERPLQINVFYGGPQSLNVLLLPRGGELLRAVRPIPSDPGAIETVGVYVGWRHQSEARDWVSSIDGTIISLGTSSSGLDTPAMVQRLRHPTKAEWDNLRVTKPPPVVATAPINSSFYNGWRNFGLADPCDLLKSALNAVPGDITWASALERYAQRVERTDFAEQARQLTQRTDSSARNDIDILLKARVCS